MAANAVAIDISDVVGTAPGADQLVPALVRAVLRTVLPETWFARGGTGSVVPVFNGKKWFLVVYNDDANAVTQITTLVATMKF